MKLIGENLNIVSKTYGPALKERQVWPIQELVKSPGKGRCGLHRQSNIGPRVKTATRLWSGLSERYKEVTDLPLSLDTTNQSQWKPD